MVGGVAWVLRIVGLDSGMLDERLNISPRFIHTSQRGTIAMVRV